MVEEALITNFMEEMRSMVEDAFKPIHERLDRLKHSRIRESQNLLHPITYPQKRLMREETSYEENFEQASRHHGSKLRRDGARDREAIKLQSTPPIQKKHDHKSLLGEKSDPWINKENQPLPQQQLSEIMAAFKAVFDVKDAEAPNQQEEIVELETVVGSKDENGPRELVLEIDVADSRDEKCPREMVIRVDEEVDVKDDGDDHTMMNEEKSMEAKWNKGNVSSTNDLDCVFSFTYSLVQAFDDVSSKDTFHGVLSIKRSEHQIELEGKKELESMLFDETKKKHNFFPFDVGGCQDLRTNPLQEEGNDGARKSWFEARRPRIIDDMG